MNPVKIKYRRLYSLLFLLVLACNNNKVSTPSADSLKPSGKDSSTAVAESGKNVITVYHTPKDFLDTISKLAFVQASNHYIDSFSQHQQGISFIVDTTASEYIVTAGYNGEQRFETYYTFSVNKKSRAIMVMDPVSGNRVAPDVFQKSQQK